MGGCAVGLLGAGYGAHSVGFCGLGTEIEGDESVYAEYGEGEKD